MILEHLALYKKELMVHGDCIRRSLFLLGHENFPRILETLISLSKSLDFISYKTTIYGEEKDFSRRVMCYIRDVCHSSKTAYLFVRIIDLVKTDLNEERDDSSILEQLDDLVYFLQHDFRVGGRHYSLTEKNIVYDYVCYILSILDENHVWSDIDHFRKLSSPIRYVLDILNNCIHRFSEFNNQTNELI